MMKKQIILLVLLIINGFHCLANSYNQLLAVNAFWQTQSTNDQKNILQKQNLQYSQKNWIGLHLQLVSNILLNKNLQHLSVSQIEKRTYLLHQLQSYAAAKNFPINDYKAYQTPIFIDKKGTHCAVGYLMQQSGAEGLARRINETEQFAYVTNIKTPGVDNWANDNGFTLQELAWIQPGYPAYTDFYNVDSGVNGIVHCMVAIDDNTILLGGDFTSNNKNITCNNLAMATNTNGVWGIKNIGTGSNAPIKCMYKKNNLIYIGGNFTSINGVPANHITVYDLLSSSQAFSTLGNGVNGNVHAISIYNNAIYIGGNFPNLLSKWNGTTWVDINQGLLMGNSINCFYEHQNELYFGGQFEFVVGSFRTNIGIINSSGNVTFTGYGQKNTINDITFWNNQLMAASTVNTTNSDSTILYRYDTLSMDWLPIQNNKNAFDFKINKFLNQGIDLYVVGKFNASDLMYTGSHFAKLAGNSVSYYLSPLLNLNAPVNCAIATNNKIFIGGIFTETQTWAQPNPTNYRANKIGFINNFSTAIHTEKSKDVGLFIYPNPATDMLYLPKNNWKAIEIFNTNGQKIMQLQPNKNNTITIKNLRLGNYIIVATDYNKKSYSATFSKQ
jgi:Secretion system C-terminal sorting domain